MLNQTYIYEYEQLQEGINNLPCFFAVMRVETAMGHTQSDIRIVR